MAFIPLRGLRILLVGVGALALASALGSVAFHLLFLRDLPDLKSVDDSRPALASVSSTWKTSGCGASTPRARAALRRTHRR